MRCGREPPPGGLPGRLARLPGSGGERFTPVFERGSLEVELYAPRGHDPQAPHRRDEMYFVVAGSGTYVCEGERTPFGPGDLLFAAAGTEHRFEAFSDDLAVWVVFYGPDGGERPAIRRILGSEVSE